MYHYNKIVSHGEWYVCVYGHVCHMHRSRLLCQGRALLCEMVPCDAMTSGFVSDLFTIHFDEKGQKKNFDETQFFSYCLQVYKMLHFNHFF